LAGSEGGIASLVGPFLSVSNPFSRNHGTDRTGLNAFDNSEDKPATMVSKLASFFKRRGGGGKGASPRCVADDDGINDNDAIPPMTIVEDDSSDEHYPSLGHKSNNNITKTYSGYSSAQSTSSPSTTSSPYYYGGVSNISRKQAQQAKNKSRDGVPIITSEDAGIFVPSDVSSKTNYATGGFYSKSKQTFLGKERPRVRPSAKSSAFGGAPRYDWMDIVSSVRVVYIYILLIVVTSRVGVSYRSCLEIQKHITSNLIADTYFLPSSHSFPSNLMHSLKQNTKETTAAIKIQAMARRVQVMNYLNEHNLSTPGMRNRKAMRQAKYRSAHITSADVPFPFNLCGVGLLFGDGTFEDDKVVAKLEKKEKLKKEMTRNREEEEKRRFRLRKKESQHLEEGVEVIESFEEDEVNVLDEDENRHHGSSRSAPSSPRY
jgi:hypothetical protein